MKYLASMYHLLAFYFTILISEEVLASEAAGIVAIRLNDDGLLDLAVIRVGLVVVDLDRSVHQHGVLLIPGYPQKFMIFKQFFQRFLLVGLWFWW